MRRRDREINIFNIAFLDVITGAMGAFILLVLLLAPYYTGPSAPPPRMKRAQQAIDRAGEQTQKMERQINRAIRAGVDPKLLAKLKKLLQKVEARLREAEKQLIRLRSEINALKERDQSLEKRLKAAKRTIARLNREIRRLKREIRRLEAHQGTAKFRPLVVFVERKHIPNGLFNCGAPFMVYAATAYRPGVMFTVERSQRSELAQNDPPFSPMSIPASHFDLSSWASAHPGKVPFPRAPGPDDEQFFTPRVNNGPGYNPVSPNTEELVIADANLRSTVDLYILLTPALAPGNETRGHFALTLSFGKANLAKDFTLTYKHPIIDFHIQVLPGERMNVEPATPQPKAVGLDWSRILEDKMSKITAGSAPK